jgi:hypothetical protein
MLASSTYNPSNKLRRWYNRHEGVGMMSQPNLQRRLKPLIGIPDQGLFGACRIRQQERG